MRIFRFLSLLAMIAIVASVLMVRPTQAQTLDTGYASAIRIQNLGTAAAKCTMTAYNEDGSASSFSSVSLPDIAINSAGYVYTPAKSTDGTAGGYANKEFPSGSFAVTLSCDQSVSAVVNFSNHSAKNFTNSKGDAFVGVSQTDAASILYVPAAYKNYYTFYTAIRIQNPTSASQDVKIEYFKAGSTTAADSKTVTVNANGSTTVDQKDATLDKDTPYSAKITGSGNLAVISMIYGGPSQYELYALSSFKGGSTNAIKAPVIMKNYYGYDTATVIQNAGTAETDVDVTYSSGKTLKYSVDGVAGKKLAAGASWTVVDYQVKDLPSGDKGLISSSIKSSDGQPLIVVVNESKGGETGNNTTARATAFEGSDTGSKKLISPTVMKGYYGYNTSITCVPTSGSTVTTGKITYVGADLSGAAVNKTDDIPAGGAIYVPSSTNVPAGFIGAATITADNEILCVINSDQDGDVTGKAVDYLDAFNAIKN